MIPSEALIYLRRIVFEQKERQSLQDGLRITVAMFQRSFSESGLKQAFNRWPDRPKEHLGQILSHQEEQDLVVTLITLASMKAPVVYANLHQRVKAIFDVEVSTM